MNNTFFKITPSLLPKKKKRGLKSYYNQLFFNARNFSIIAKPEHWFDHWHHHIDELNISNKSWKHRLNHLKALCLFFKQLAKETEKLNIPFQLWLIAHEKNGFDDAVFLHTPNPQSEFPIKIEDVDWEDNNIATYFQKSLGPYDIKAGVWYDNDLNQKIYILYSPSVGKAIH